MLKATEKDKELRLSEEAQKLNTLRAEMEWKLQCLEPRERKVEAMVAKVRIFCSLFCIEITAISLMLILFRVNFSPLVTKLIMVMQL